MFENPWDTRSQEEKGSSRQQERERILKFLRSMGYRGNNSPQNGSILKLVYLILAVIVVMWLLTGFFTVDTDEEGIVMRFGKYNRYAMPGLNYKLPDPIETVEKISVTRIKRDVIGKITNPIAQHSKIKHLDKDGTKQSEADLSYPKESQMLTGDENIIDMHFYVQWRIGSAQNYLFNIKDNQGDNIVRNTAESVMRQVIGEVTISEALSERRLGIEQKVKKELQEILNSYNSGIEIISVGILYSYVGPEVRDAYRDVQSAKADRERFINQAQAYSNEIIPKAKGEARAIIESALGYKESEIAKAEGDAQKFDEVYKAYSANKDITKKRMYLDTMDKIYGSTNKVVIDKDIAKGVLPYLPLDKIQNKQN
ncbi:FtsH protease activity modulator HflK [Candidatus Bandiella euplotis]|uniref:Protein HflK n=1 Tax=Candidatus Bandiella euplotis TaxID=1664265 RepID=A0ABZ0UPM7_9RICK|nr:FtsH protease activity modulator HflK [Candidatus Bandiella woodruffii]WPX97083.1 Modulator of FtsH protease HflK [Candidatus Bandiella woodruffii]